MQIAAQLQHVMGSQTLSAMMMLMDGVAAASPAHGAQAYMQSFASLPLTAPSLCMILSKASSDGKESVML